MTTSVPDDPLDLVAHVEAIERAIQEFVKFQMVTKETRHHRVVKTAAACDVVLLGAVTSTIDQKNRHVRYSSPYGPLEVLRTVHRSFFSSLHMVIELNLRRICEEKSINVVARQKESFVRVVERLQSASSGTQIRTSDLKRLRSHFERYRPSFEDHLVAVLDATHAPEDSKKAWRMFFKAMSIVRNKVSHSDGKLSEEEIATLNGAGFRSFARDGVITFHVANHPVAIQGTLNFFNYLVRHLGV